LRRTQIETLRNDSKQAQVVAATQSKSAKMQKADAEIEALERQLANLRQVYKDNYPSVRQVQQFLQVARDNRAKIQDEEAAAAAVAAAAAAETKSDEPVMNPAVKREIDNLELAIQYSESQIKAKDVEIEDARKQLKAMNATAANAQASLASAPVGAQEYAEILREQALAKDKYNKASSTLTMAEAGFKMEDRKQGETLSVLDAASLPSEPASPKRGMVVAIGAGIGILLGIVVAGAREMKDTSLKNLKDVRAYTQMAILGSVPLLEIDFVVRRRRRIAWLGWTSACLMSVLVMAGAMVYYYASKG
jgi:uncharacterized protein involved in exopolysaccharide biosynthesis